MRRKRDLQKQTNIREMALRSKLNLILGSDKLMERMARYHQDILQNIEFTLVTGYRDNHSIDDCIIADALEAAIRGSMPQDDRAISLNNGLQSVCQFRSDVSDDIWRDCLRVVLQSVHRHSTLEPGCRLYLEFVSDFIL
jgi:hypothetical protein